MIGKLSGLFLLFYGLFRFLVEFIREPDQHIGLIIFNMSLGQILSIIFKPTHKIKILKSQVYFGSDKTRKKASNKWLPFGSELKIIKKDKNFIMFEKNQWIKFNDICLNSKIEKNFSMI